MSNLAASGPWIPQWSFGDKLRRVRRELGLSQVQMADRLAINQSAYSAWESDRNRPSDLVRTAKQIQLATGVPASWLLGIDEAPRPDGPDGGQVVRHQGLEPRTRWFGDFAGHSVAYLNRPELDTDELDKAA